MNRLLIAMLLAANPIVILSNFGQARSDHMAPTSVNSVVERHDTDDRQSRQEDRRRNRGPDDDKRDDGKDRGRDRDRDRDRGHDDRL
ncbi:MAG TPA: hypothetical protein VLJ17_09645 [Xanthobacteraceae bacterium]|nr:hypothetical protein [Xanthobacteraceae bacterium]